MGQKEQIKKVFEYEDMDWSYIQHQLNGLIMEIKKPKERQAQYYIDEKIANMLRHFEGTVRNFGARMNHETCQKGFLKMVK